MLPLLVVLFLISYGLMAMLIVEQGSTIESQRGLIRELFHDSTELSAAKGKAIVDKNAAQRRAQTQAPNAKSQTPSTPTPSTQAPSLQTPSTQDPSTQVAPQRRTQAHPGRVQKALPPPTRPPADLADDRRALITI